MVRTVASSASRAAAEVVSLVGEHVDSVRRAPPGHHVSHFVGGSEPVPLGHQELSVPANFGQVGERADPHRGPHRDPGVHVFVGGEDVRGDVGAEGVPGQQEPSVGVSPPELLEDVPQILDLPGTTGVGAVAPPHPLGS